MNNKKNLDKDTEKELGILRQLDKNPSTSQRDLAEEIGVSLGKINFLLNELIKKGLIKIDNFSKNKSKINYIYLLTPKESSIEKWVVSSLSATTISPYEISDDFEAKSGL